MIKAISGTRLMLIPDIIRAQNSNGKLAVPVRPAVARYAQFKHIRGVPSAENEAPGIPITKLQILDTLIEKLVGKQAQGEAYLKLAGQDADRLISRLQTEYKNMLTTGSGLYQSTVATGIVLNMLV